MFLFRVLRLVLPWKEQLAGQALGYIKGLLYE
jgi:hypothetical protein